MSKTGLVASGFAIALVAGTAVFVTTVGRAQAPGEPAPPAATDPAGPPATSQDGDVRVTAPQATVKVDKERGKVSVRAPASAVDVDVDAGQVKVRAPYVNLDVRW